MIKSLDTRLICSKCYGTGRLQYSDGELMSYDLGECPVCYGTGHYNPNYKDDDDDDDFDY